jgi:D-glycero-D-manno-heptose 1,7-bisphosphate phosphatase
MTTVIFIDKDGTLIEDLPYNVDPRRIRLAPGAEEALAIWADQGWPLAIITNQSGVARGGDHRCRRDMGRVLRVSAPARGHQRIRGRV